MKITKNRLKYWESLKGKRLPVETRKKMSKAKKGIRQKNYDEMRKNAGFENANYSGEKHWNWKGGISTVTHVLRNCAKYQIWRNLVFLRDNFICQECGVKNGDGKTICLNAHHIRKFSEYPELMFDVNNGITYCKECHKNLHFPQTKLKMVQLNDNSK